MSAARACLLGVALALAACSAAPDGPVATADEAVARARVAWRSTAEKASTLPEYRKENTAKFEPYTASLENGSWVVRGVAPAGYHGPMLETRVRQRDGAVSITSVEAK